MGQMNSPLARCVFGALILCSTALADDSTRQVEKLTSLEYPPVAAQARVEGTIQLRCEVAQDGSVKAVTAVAGNEILAKAARGNAMKWRFSKAAEPPVNRKSNLVTLIYRFRLTGVCERSVCPTSFSFEVPNVVLVESQAPRWQP